WWRRRGPMIPAIPESGKTGAASWITAADVEFQVRIENVALVARWVRFGVPLACVLWLAAASVWEAHGAQAASAYFCCPQGGEYWLVMLVSGLWSAACSGTLAGFLFFLPPAALSRGARRRLPPRA